MEWQTLVAKGHSARVREFEQAAVDDQLRRASIDALVAIGGDGTVMTTQMLHKAGVPRGRAQRNRQRRPRQLLDDFLWHYYANRPHRSLGHRGPDDQVERPVIEPAIPINRSTTCAGLINEYRQAA